MDIFSELASSIIKEQENIIGPLAFEQAQKVSGLTIDTSTNRVSVSGNQTEVLEQLIEKYRDLFGMASVEVCRDAAKPFLSKLTKDQLPQLLQ